MEVHARSPCLFECLCRLEINSSYIRLNRFLELTGNVVNLQKFENCNDSLRLHAEELAIGINSRRAKCEMQGFLNLRCVADLAGKCAIKWNGHARSI